MSRHFFYLNVSREKNNSEYLKRGNEEYYLPTNRGSSFRGIEKKHVALKVYELRMRDLAWNGS